MIRISPGLYRLTDSTFARKLGGSWFVTDDAGNVLSGPYSDVLNTRGWTARNSAAARARRATIRERTQTSPHPRGGVLVQVTSPAGPTIPTVATVRKVTELGPFRWQLHSLNRGGDSPLFVAAIIAAAHAIDESEAPS